MSSTPETPAERLVEIVALRDPDASNDYTVFIDGKRAPQGVAVNGLKIVLFDMDPGATIEGADPEVVREWCDDEREAADRVLTPAAAAYARTVADSYDVDDSELPDDDEDDDEDEDRTILVVPAEIRIGDFVYDGGMFEWTNKVTRVEITAEKVIAFWTSTIDDRNGASEWMPSATARVLRLVDTDDTEGQS